ncbi:uncharacterized protein BX663DRAFT_533310 [Cokeromyces recurvatus]|uniref:uncharacterized protein n=1 Tax=Cokeromyces recurvatus TaxID=90255 RepID=UPI002220D0E5|nr:uncharacterized protein BX663DRAFT_533310 [Cokeromyces recurvatus]KAI7898562.1 hypothetical protein BX663DRAFT_533310 [Cokeromyces recurvatus]
MPKLILVNSDISQQYRWPSIISSPMNQLLGEACYISLFEEFHFFSDIQCIKLAISKALGLGIVIGGAIVKIPQIITILRHKSAQGLSLASFLLETCAYLIVLMYNTRLYHPFSTYGEVLFMTLQNIVITMLIVYYNNKQARTMMKMTILLLLSTLVVTVLMLLTVPSWFMALLYAAQIPIGLASKIPQIRANYINQSTGQLSVFAVLNYFLGTTARTFTTWTELDDPIMLGGNLIASFLNGILVLQLFIYWKKRKLPSSSSSLPKVE